MNIHLKLSVLCFTLLLTFVSDLQAQARLDYPELMVTPGASTRIKMEAEKERKQGIGFQLPITISASLTLLAGILQMGNVDKSKDEDELSPYYGILVGAGWLGINYYLAAQYNAYGNAWKEVASLPKKSIREKLVRERVAEAHIHRLGRLGRKLRWLSFATNAVASGLMMSKVEKDSTSELTNVIAILASLGPVMFSNNWVDVRREHKHYKKRIYSPVVNSTILFDPGSRKVLPGLRMAFTF